MLLQYAAIAAFVIITAVVGFIAIGLGMLFGPKRSTDNKAMPYESGMNPIGPGTRRIPVRFYMVAVLFKLSSSCPGQLSSASLGCLAWGKWPFLLPSYW